MTNERQTGKPPPEAGAGLELCLRLSRASATLARRMDLALGSFHGLSFSDFTLLYNLAHAPGGRLRRIALADQLGLSASGVTRALIPLEKIGLVKRQADARDARVGYAVLTGAGGTLLAAAMESAEAVSDEALQAVPARQMESLSAALGQLGGNRD